MSTEQDKAAAAPAAVETKTEAPAAAVSTPAVASPLTKLSSQLSDIVAAVGYREMWGVELSNLDHVPTKVVLQKFLRANNDDPAAAETQLKSALEWRKKMQPAKLVEQAYSKKKFQDLGFVTIHKDEAGKEVVITWNIYGAVKNNKVTFGNLEEFIKWRAAVMELGTQKLKLNEVTEPIPEGGEDPYQMIQVHDYLSVSFFRMDPAVKAATKETIHVLSTAYPELLRHKYFVNVPAIMGWMYGAMKLFLAPATLRKFHPMASGTTLATELKGIVSSLPKEYGGQGPSVKEGLTVTLVDEKEASKEAPVEASTENVPVATEAPVSEQKPVEETKPAEDVKPAEEVKAAEETKPADEVKLEETKTAAEPSDAAPKEPEASVTDQKDETAP